jgi:hypothetical protein
LHVLSLVAEMPVAARVAGQPFPPLSPATAGAEFALPFRDDSGVDPRQPREACE